MASRDFQFLESEGVVVLASGERLALSDPRAFEAVSNGWLRCGWDVKYVYGFSWLGRPIIQLPEDLLRIQELVNLYQPDVIVETGIAHGGGLVFYASLCAALGHGRVIGVDIEIRPHNREAIDAHRLRPLIDLVVGSSTEATVVDRVRELINGAPRVLIILDSNHTRDHVAAELEAYAPFVGPGGYLVACDGIMARVAGAPRTQPDWTWNNPLTAVQAFLDRHPEFERVPPPQAFNESALRSCITYWPNGYLRRRSEA